MNWARKMAGPLIVVIVVRKIVGAEGKVIAPERGRTALRDKQSTVGTNIRVRVGHRVGIGSERSLAGGH